MMLIHGGRIASAGVWNGEARDLVIAEGRIRDIVEPGSVTGDVERISAAGMLIIPGLVNAHTHAHGNVAKGIADRWALETFLSWGRWTMGHDTEHSQVAALIGAAEMLRRGCTAAYDMFGEYPLPSPEGIEAVADAYQSIGMRAVIAPLLADRSIHQAMPGLIESMPDGVRDAVASIAYVGWERSLAACRETARGWRRPADRLKFALGPTIAFHCSDSFLTGLRDLARENGLGISMHIAESKPDVIASLEHYGRSSVAHLEALGLLGPHFVAAHSVWIDDADADLFAKHGVTVAHNPAANMKLGSGLADMRQFLDRGITVGIGTDGSRSSDNQNMLEAMRLAAFTSRVIGRPPSDWISAPEAFAAATIGSAAALGWAGEIGRIAKGYQADLVFLTLAESSYLPLNDAIAQVVFCEDGTGVDTVMVNGQILLRGGRFTQFRPETLARRVEAAMDAMWRRNADVKASAQRLEPHVAAYARELTQRVHHINRFAGRRTAVDGPL
jgi:5-methylthioadenosine/S-adenosylhomocysteine deaminase